MAKTAKKIVAIGGGKGNASTLPIDREIIRLSQKKRPKLFFIPTASSDDECYWKQMDRYYGKMLGCKTDVLFLVREAPSPKEIREKILGADIIYVGGGNTLKMMRLWHRLGVDRLLEKAWQRGTVLCGISAGSICWFESGHSDSMSYYSPKKWKYIRVRGLGLLKGIHCPHYDSQTLGVPRKSHFRGMMRKIGGMGIAIDNDCAIEFIGDKYRVIASKKSAKAFRVFRNKGKVHSKIIPKSRLLAPTTALFEI